MLNQKKEGWQHDKDNKDTDRWRHRILPQRRRRHPRRNRPPPRRNLVFWIVLNLRIRELGVQGLEVQSPLLEGTEEVHRVRNTREVERLESERNWEKTREPPKSAVLFSSACVLAVGRANGRVLGKSVFCERFRAKFPNADRVWIDVENFQSFCAVFCAF